MFKFKRRASPRRAPKHRGAIGLKVGRCEDSAQTPVGYPMVNVRDIESWAR
jgi:hypothetical protein